MEPTGSSLLEMERYINPEGGPSGNLSERFAIESNAEAPAPDSESTPPHSPPSPDRGPSITARWLTGTPWAKKLLILLNAAWV